ncbi:MAG: hypothetical protein H6839_02505 [Planctomycetes bacterium]|nr:hypothetical protein [Planctomycetota bacterium]
MLLLLAACAPPDPAPRPVPRSLEAAETALRAADVEQLRAELGKGRGLAQRGHELAARLDPPAWLVAMGADEREHDLVAAIEAMRAGDDMALQAALGFGPQDLAASIFNGGASVYARRAGGRNYYESGPQPLDLLNHANVPSLPEGWLASGVTLWGTMEGRQFRVDYTLDATGVVNLDGGIWQATTSMKVPPRTTHYADPMAALPAAARVLSVSGLVAPQFWGARLRLIGVGARVLRVELGRDENGWALCDYSDTALQERLGAIRDERLDFIRRRALGFQRSSGRWPRGLHELTFAKSELSDPTSSSGRLGWGDYDAAPSVDFEVAPSEDAEYAAACKESTSAGRRAVSVDGSFFWLKP